MTQHEFHAFFHELSHERLVRPSEAIEGAIEMQVRETLVCVEWNDAERRLEITVPLIDLFDEHGGDDPLRLRLYQALLAWQWREPTGASHLSFGLVEDLDQVVGMASIPAQDLSSAEALGSAIAEVRGRLLEVWLDIGMEVLAERLDAEQEPMRPVLGPSSRRI